MRKAFGRIVGFLRGGAFLVWFSLRACLRSWLPTGPEIRKVWVGAELLGLVQFPSYWSHRDPATGDTQILSGHHELRRSSSDPEALLIALHTAQVATSYSDEAYVVRLGPPVQVLPATPADWATGTPVPRRRGQTVFGSPKRARSIRYGGREFKGLKGATIYDAFPSPGGKWLALLSSNEPAPKGGGFLFFGGGDRPAWGGYFLDVLEQSTGRRVVAARLDSDFAFHGSFWAGEDFFFMPAGHGEHTILVANLSGQRALTELLREPPPDPLAPAPVEGPLPKATGPGHEIDLGPPLPSVRPPYATLVSLRDAAIEDPSTGFITEVVVTAEVLVRTPGHYRLTVGLGRAQATDRRRLEAGKQVMAVAFRGLSLPGGLDGPLQADAFLYAEDDYEHLAVDVRRGAGVAQPYTQARIARRDAFLTGKDVVAGLDVDGDGKFDLLTIQREVYVSAAGPYQWQANLRDAANRELGVYIGTGELRAGLNQLFLEFSGRAICVDGPYRITLFVLGGGRERGAIHEGPLTTEAFAASAFVGGGCQAGTIVSGLLSFGGALQSGRFETPVEVTLSNSDGSFNASQVPVTLSLAAGPHGATLRGETTRWTSRGKASFAVHLSQPGAGFVLRATTPGMASAESAPFEVRR